jgi:hypothetical protein
MDNVGSQLRSLGIRHHRHPHRGLPSGLGCLVVACAVLLAGCTVVRPYQRESLAERCMAPGFGDKSEVKFRAHWEYARHGTQGGFGDDAGGGGCGCN